MPVAAGESENLSKRISDAFLVSGLIDPTLGFWHVSKESVRVFVPRLSMDAEKQVKETHPGIIYCLTVCATLSGLLFGYDTAIINGALIVIEGDFKLTSGWVGLIVSSTMWTAAVFSLLSGVVADAIGRKTTIMISAVIFAGSGVIMGAATSPGVLLAGRGLAGVAVGFVSSVVPIYISECAPSAIRGLLITMNQLFITIGIVLSAIAAGALQSFSGGWRIMLGVSVLPAIVQLIMFFGLPESPRYQMMKEQESKAEATLKQIRKKDDVSAELADMRRTLEEEKMNKGWEIWKKIFSTPHVRKALFLGCMLQFFQQFCGINTVFYYSSTILKNAGFSSKLAIWLAVIPATINFLATFIGLWAVESLGRKLVLALSFLAIAASLLVLCAGFLLGQINSPASSSLHEGPIFNSTCGKHPTCYECIKKSECGYCYLSVDGKVKSGSCAKRSDDEGFSSEGRCLRVNETKIAFVPEVLFASKLCPSEYGWIAVLGMVLFVLGFAPGAGPMPWTINAEIYPQWSRSVANSIATLSNWVSNAILSYYFLMLIQTITPWGTFLAFCVVCIIAAIFVLALVPETKDKSLEDIELLFMTEDVRKETIEKRKKRLSSVPVEIPPEAPPSPPKSPSTIVVQEN